MIDSAAESTSGENVGPMSDLRFDKITDQLDKQVICVGQVRFSRNVRSREGRWQRVDGVGAAELFADGFPLIAARCKRCRS